MATVSCEQKHVGRFDNGWRMVEAPGAEAFSAKVAELAGETGGTKLGGWLVCRMCVKKREVAKRVNSQLAGVPTQKTRSVEVVLEGSAASGTEISEVDKRDRI